MANEEARERVGRQVVCRSCGAPIHWGVTAGGQSVPIDPSTGASHYTTCPDADVWSKKKDRTEVPGQGTLFGEAK